MSLQNGNHRDLENLWKNPNLVVQLPAESYEEENRENNFVTSRQQQLISSGARKKIRKVSASVIKDRRRQPRNRRHEDIFASPVDRRVSTSTADQENSGYWTTAAPYIPEADYDEEEDSRMQQLIQHRMGYLDSHLRSIVREHERSWLENFKMAQQTMASTCSINGKHKRGNSSKRKGVYNSGFLHEFGNPPVDVIHGFGFSRSKVLSNWTFEAQNYQRAGTQELTSAKSSHMREGRPTGCRYPRIIVRRQIVLPWKEEQNEVQENIVNDQCSIYEDRWQSLNRKLSNCSNLSNL